MANALSLRDAFGKKAVKFYQRFPIETRKHGITLEVQEPKRFDENLDAHLDAILQYKDPRSEDLILVTHGNKRGM
jgi:hypothetical protein